MAEDLHLLPGQTVLDLDCGCGAIAEHIAERTGATTYGINLDASQIEKAHRNPNLPAANFTIGDFNQPLTFDDAGFELVSSVGRSAVELIKKEVAGFDRYEAVFKALAKVRIIPRKTDTLMLRMNQNSQSYIAAEEAELLTLNWHCIGQKPEEPMVAATSTDVTSTVVIPRNRGHDRTTGE